MRLTDESKMPFGKYKGDMMINVPAEYLIWLNDEFNEKGANHQDARNVRIYIIDNMDALEEEIKRNKK